MKVRPIVAGTALVCVALVLTGCSSDSDSSSTSSTTTTKEAVCSDKESLESSVEALTDIDLTEGTNAITAALDQVKDDLDALGDSVQTDLQPEVDDVKSALSDLETAVGDFGDGSLTDDLQATGNAIAEVGSSAADMFSALSTKCPSS